MQVIPVFCLQFVLETGYLEDLWRKRKTGF